MSDAILAVPADARPDSGEDPVGFALTAEQSMLKDVAARVLADTENASRGDALWPRFAELGWLALNLPETHGGIGPAPVETATIAEQLGRYRVTEPWVASVVLAASLLADTGPADTLDALLPGVADGTVRLAFAHAEAQARGTLAHIACTARPEARGWVLSGQKTAIAGGDVATHTLVTARVAGTVRDPTGIALFLLPTGREGLVVESGPGLDGAPAVSLALHAVPAAAGDLLAADAFPAIDVAVDRALAAWCAEAVGAAERLLEMTVEYTGTRVQFGRPLSANQVVRHRLADMAVALEEARALTVRATALMGRPTQQRRRAVAAAKVKTGRATRYVAEQAIQLHGGMGVTDELPVGAFLRRLLVLDLMFGSAEDHLRRHGASRDDGEDDGLLTLGETDRRFQGEIRRFVAQNLTDDVRRAQDLTASVYAEPEVSQPWHRLLHGKGWVAPGWPAEFGGPGWSATQRYIFETEMSRASAPMLHPQGLRLVGPVIMRYGTDEQKRYYLPRILSGEDYWCQGYSEPEAGSDLASLKTRAVQDGDHYVVNGTKMWTTHAHHSNRMFALVRTSQEARRQDGISFLLIDMDTPGISVRPITTIGGDHEVNQVFLDDVRVPVANRVGGEGEGWGYGKFLLEFERGSAIVSGRLRRALRRVERLADTYRDGDRPLREDPDIAARLSEIAIDIDALEMMELQVLSASVSGERPGSSISSILKLRVSQLHQEIAKLGLRVVGDDALPWESARPFYNLNRPPHLPEDVLPVTARYLDTRAYTIFGGTAEIQHDIIARSVIGR